MTARAAKQRHSLQIQKRARAGVKGLIISWVDPDPLKESTEIITANVSHRNPVYRLTAQKIFRDYNEWIMRKQAFRWLINVDLIFDEGEPIERELEAVAPVASINEHCMEAIEEAFDTALLRGCMEHYTHTKFTIECLGNQ